MRHEWAYGPGAIVFAGRFGSGKTETAINYALRLAQGVTGGDGGPEGGGTTDRVILIDLDVVTPYFRSREMAEAVATFGVEVIAPSAVGQHLDTPAITPRILGAIQQLEQSVVLDVGGDRQGARALGQFSQALRERGYTMHFVVNPYRPFTETVEGLAASISEIEASARLEVTSLVSNPNLIGETSVEQITQGHAKIKGFAKTLGLPIAFVCVERRWREVLDATQFALPVLFLQRHFVMAWE